MTKTSRLRSRLLSAALALAMLFTMAPTGAFAADTTIIVGAGGTAGYENATAATLQKAFDDIAGGGTVKMNSSIENMVKTTILLDGGAGGKTVTLDLNGKTISGECSNSSGTDSAGLISLKAGTDANLIITDTSEAKDGKIIGQTSGKAIVNYGTGTLTLQNGTVSAVGDLTAIDNRSSGAFVMTGGTVESAGDISTIYNTGSVTISGGVVRGVKGNAIASSGATSNVEVAGGIVTGQGSRTILMHDGSLKVTGGTISNTANPEGYSVYLASSGNPTYTQTGGTVGRVDPSYNISGTILGSSTNTGIPATLQLKNSGGAAIGDPVTATAYGRYTIKDVRPDTGYTITVSCIGYTEGTITAFDVTSSNIDNKNLTLQKIRNVHTISFHVNAADFSVTAPTPEATNPDTDKLTDLPTISRDGYTFEGWFTDPDGGTKITLDTVFTQSTAVYAHWTKNAAPTAYTISFDVNAIDFSGSVPTAQTTTTDTHKLTSLPTISRDGYTFDGWFTAASGGTKITLDTVFTQNTTVYAHWTKNAPIAFTIGFNVNAIDFSGTAPTAQTTTTDTHKLTSLPTISRDGYTFDGWFTAASGGTKITLDTVFTQNATVYAHWTKNAAPTTYTVSFDVNVTNFLSAVPAAQTTTSDTHKLTSLPTISRVGYAFDGWFTAASGGTKITLDTVFTQNATVYAHWTKNSSDNRRSGSGTTAPASSVDDFTDVQNHWAKDAIAYVVDENLFKGVTDDAFAPDAPMTRAMLWTVLARNASVDTTGGASWYEQAQLWVVSTKISDGTKPNSSITREELATILYRLAGSPDVSAMVAGKFTDSSQVSAYATDAIRWATSTGILKGTDTGRLAPKAGATRAEVATMLMRYLSK